MPLSKWDQRLMNMAELIQSWSKLGEHARGAVIARDDHSVVSLGFNGFARDVSDDIERIEDEALRQTLTINAGENAIFYSKSKDFAGCSLYLFGPFPSLEEIARLAQYRIETLVVLKEPTGPQATLIREVMRESQMSLQLLMADDYIPLDRTPIAFDATGPIDKWDRRYLELARLVATWSKDPSTQVGAVMVRSNKSTASVGFNGLPRGVWDLPWRLNDRAIKYPLTLHAEENALRFAREPFFDQHTIYVWPCQPCGGCMSRLAQNGVRHVVTVTEAGNDMEQRWAESFRISNETAAETKVKVQTYFANLAQSRIQRHDADPIAADGAVCPQCQGRFNSPTRI